MQGKILSSQQLSVTTAVTVYTVPANTTTKITHGVICNTGATAAVINMSLVPSGGSVDGTHRIISGYNLAAGDSLPLGEYLSHAMLAPGDLVAVTTSVANAVDVVLTGAESA
jgi:hypothetical protein